MSECVGGVEKERTVTCIFTLCKLCGRMPSVFSGDRCMSTPNDSLISGYTLQAQYTEDRNMYITIINGLEYIRRVYIRASPPPPNNTCNLVVLLINFHHGSYSCLRRRLVGLPLQQLPCTCIHVFMYFSTVN